MDTPHDPPPVRARTTDLALVLIDVQPRFVETMHGSSAAILARLEQLLIISGWFELPVLATFEEPVEDKGRLPEQLAAVFPPDGQTFAKQTFGITGESEITAALEQLGRHQLAVAGAETDVCVLQSVLGLRELGYDVLLLEDCLFSSEPDVETALRRMYTAGTIPSTYKSLYYELLETNDPTTWQPQQQRAIQQGFVSPETLPPRH